VNLSLPIVSDPFTDLFTFLEIAGSHHRAVQSEPFPIPIGNSIHHETPGMDAAILVIFDVLFLHKAILRHHGQQTKPVGINIPSEGSQSRPKTHIALLTWVARKECDRHYYAATADAGHPRR